MENWREVAGWESLYEVSDQGRVRSLPRTFLRRDGKPLRTPGKVLTAQPNGRGYCRVTLFHQDLKRWSHVHSLVAEAFLPRPPGILGSRRGEYNVNHKDGVKTNNHVDNLEYITGLENVLHARANKLLDVIGEGNGRAKVTEEMVKRIRVKYAAGARQVDLADEFGIDQTSISRIVRRETWVNVA